VGRNRNYGFDRRRKAEDRRAKQESKRQRRADRAESGTSGPEMGEAQNSGIPPDTWEWFSPSRTRTMAAPRGTRPEAGPPDDWLLLTEVDDESEPKSPESDS
jgi:hypothetical protein